MNKKPGSKRQSPRRIDGEIGRQYDFTTSKPNPYAARFKNGATVVALGPRGAESNTRVTAALSSKGQVLIPEEIRSRLGLKTGARFVVIADRDLVILKVIGLPRVTEFASLAARARHLAKRIGLRPAAITRAVTKVRRSR